MTDAPPPILGSGACFEGLLALAGPARIDGCVRGRVETDSALWVGPTGVVEADLKARSVVIAGRILGEVRASERIELLPSALVEGDLEAPQVILADGARVNGRCRSGVSTD
jgi:cytoskeletal protein CcmA (bactofilin family)